MFKLIKNSSNIVESRGPYSQFVILLSLYMCVCVLVTKWGPEYTFHQQSEDIVMGDGWHPLV